MPASATASTRQSRWRRSRPFFRENSEHNKERFADPEIRLLFLLQAFLQRALDGGGRSERESGRTGSASSSRMHPRASKITAFPYSRMNFGRWRPSPRRKDAPKDHGEPFYPTATPGGRSKRERGPPEPAWFDCEQSNAMILSETHG